MGAEGEMGDSDVMRFIMVGGEWVFEGQGRCLFPLKYVLFASNHAETRYMMQRKIVPNPTLVVEFP